ncbi:lactoylglutathione lyase [Sphingomonas gilva]|uniref:Lactoylglutathione lyase n=1 Tax=Sphingomonas gilva TaxID=2305907 RepID=A0A396RQ98_9SPHN|nr:VOC family protein [Sphingomonas gilva]RHW18764.1 lactoylglutathione lyase [Sphingomonas gilva]
MSKMIFVNLPVNDIAAATRFYEAIGCTQNPQFSDDNASSMMWSDGITFQLLHRDYFATFIAKPVADAKASCEVLIALSCDTRETVDQLVQAGEGAGGNAGVRAPMDLGFMYNRAVEDPDGHVLELAWMDPSGMPEG